VTGETALGVAAPMVGIGVDAVDVERFRLVLARTPTVLGRIFTDAERADVARRSDPVPGLAARFAAKEAAMKALGVGLGSFGLADVEVVRSQRGAPELRTSGRAAVLADARGVLSWYVSLTHTATLAAAVVLAR
jgi:holo-[acyl-carrier protein] synthase